MSFSKGPLRYSATYRRIGNEEQGKLEIVADRADSICVSRVDEDWATRLRVLQRDLRGQVFVRSAQRLAGRACTFLQFAP